ncbi:MAG TPA: phasin family protein [Burkholderiales bacterium]
MIQPQAELFDLYRAGLKTAADMMKSSLESAERLQNQQLVALRGAIEQQAKSVTELATARTLDELIAAQSRIAEAQIEQAMGLWSGFFQAAGESQRIAIGRARSWLDDSAAVGSATARAPKAKSA